MTLPYYLPYYPQPSWDIPFPIVGELTIHAFGVLVALALVVGTWVSRWQGMSRGQDPTAMVDACTWTSISGFVVAHLVSVIFYFPERVLEDPLQLLYIWNGLSSFGGFLGGALGAYIFLKRRGIPILAFVDTISVGLAPGWVLGRLGCTVAHDHPGISTTFPLAFDHPDRGPIHDLGFYEFIFAIFITIVVFATRGRKWPVGANPAMMCILYAPVRFGLDYLRVHDAVYDGLTPGQWMAVVLLLGGITLWVYAWQGLKWTYLVGLGGLAAAYGLGRLVFDFAAPTGELLHGMTWGQWIALAWLVSGGILIYLALRVKAAGGLWDPRRKAAAAAAAGADSSDEKVADSDGDERDVDESEADEDVDGDAETDAPEEKPKPSQKKAKGGSKGRKSRKKKR